jgi:organic radical activating enzyme
MVDSDGSIKLCCSARHTIRNDDGTEANITNTTLDKVWNNKHMQEIRQNMIDGVKPANGMCENCYDSEKYNGESSRTNELTEMDEFCEEINVYIDTPIVEELPDYYDLRFGNLCNLQCIMCDPHYSSRLMTEQEKVFDLLKNNLEHTNYELEERYELSNSKWNRSEAKKYSWPANNDIFNSIVDRMSHSKCRKVYVNGGEPTLHNKSLTNMVNTLVESGQAGNIELWLNTNATIVDTKFYKLLDNFKRIRLMLSIDGIEESFEYIRYPAKWNIVDSNIKKIVNCVRNFENSHNWRIEFQPTFQLLNLLDIDKMIEYWLNIRKDMPCYFSVVKLNDPDWYDVTIANTNIKNEIKKKLESKFSNGDEELAINISYITNILEHQEASIENDRELLLRHAGDMHEIYRKTRNIEHLDEWFKSTISQLK